jgi:hypothetical protein
MFRFLVPDFALFLLVYFSLGNREYALTEIGKPLIRRPAVLGLGWNDGVSAHAYIVTKLVDKLHAGAG